MGSTPRHIILLILTASLVLITPLSGKTAISVSQSIDRTELAFEDTAGFRITVTWDGPVFAYRFDKALRASSDKLKVARYSSSVRSTGTGPSEVTTKVFEYQLAPILSGIARIEPLTLEYVTWPDSLVGQLVTDAVSLAIAEPIPVEERTKGGLSGGLIALIVVAVLGAGVGAFALFKPKPRAERVKSPAESFLEGLESARRDAGMDLKKFQSGVYRALIRYIRDRYGNDLTGRSAEVIAQELSAVEPDLTVRETLSAWLARAEKEKFSPFTPAPGEVSRLESEIRSFFEKLK